MSLKSIAMHALGVVVGILIPGSTSETANKTHTVQQHLADLFGLALTDLSKKLATDTTGLTGPQKIFVTMRALVETAKAQGFKGDLAILEATALDVAQAAYRQIAADPEAEITALAVALSQATGLTGVSAFAADVVEVAIAAVRGVGQPVAATLSPQPG